MILFEVSKIIYCYSITTIIMIFYHNYNYHNALHYRSVKYHIIMLSASNSTLYGQIDFGFSPPQDKLTNLEKCVLIIIFCKYLFNYNQITLVDQNHYDRV